MNDIELLIKFDDETRETASIYIEGNVNEVNCQFLLDTGCAKTVLTQNEFSAQFKSIGSQISSGVFGRSEYELIELDSLTVGPIQERNLVISRAMKGGIDRNLLGMDVLKNYRLFFRIEDAKVETQNRDISDIKVNPLFLDEGGIPYVDVKCGDAIGKAVWDTGAGVTLVDINFINRNQGNFEKVGTSSGTDSTGTSNETPTYKMKQVKIGGLDFRPHTVVGLDLSHVNSKIDHPFDFLLGYSTIRQANWFFDFPGKSWGLAPAVT